jgi:glutamate dehydrogenase/leucine dehydrogenase
VHVDNADRIQARIIAAGANNPITPEAERRLFARGVVCLPDFVTNCGGVLGGRMDLASIDSGRIAAFVAQYLGARMARLLEESAATKIPTRDIAEPLALRRLEQVRLRNERFGPQRRLFHLAMDAYRRGLVPCSLVGVLALPYFRRMLRL